MSQRAPSTRPIPPSPGNAEQYVSVPGAPYSPPRSRNSVPISLLRKGGTVPRVQHHTSSNSVAMQPKPSSPSARNQTAEDVQMHALGGGFGPYAVCYNNLRPSGSATLTRTFILPFLAICFISHQFLCAPAPRNEPCRLSREFIQTRS